MSDTNKAITVIERGEVTDSMSPVVRAILEKDPSPETLEKLLAVQREYDKDRARKAFDTAMVLLKGDLPAVIVKDKEVRFKEGGAVAYKHATLASILGQIEAPLARHGFTLAWTTSDGEGNKVRVTCRLSHIAGHSTETSLSAPPDPSGSKNNVQAVGSTVTYLERYTALSLLGLTTGDAPDVDDEAPDGPQGGERIDAKRNMDAVDKLKRYGKTRADAEEFLGRTIAGWTVADLGKLQAWAKSSRPPEAA